MQRLSLLVLSTVLLLGSRPVIEEPPSGFDLLAELQAEVRRSGEWTEALSIVFRDPDGESQRFGRLRVGPPPLYRLDLCAEPSCAAPSQIFWRDAAGGVHVRSGKKELLPPTLSEALLLHLDTDLAEAMLVARLLAGDEKGLPDPVATTVDGPAPCPQATARSCWLLSLSGQASGEVHELWIDVESHRLHQVRFVRPTVASVLSGRAGSDLGGIEVVVQSLESEPELEMAFAPAPLSIATDPSPDRSASAIRAFHESLDVRLATVVVRAVEADGTPLSGLGRDDFRLRVGKRMVAIDAVDWRPRVGPSFDELPLEEMARQGISLDPGGRLVVFFVQAGLEAIRLKGHRRMLHQVDTLLEGLGVEDRAAVVSFDSHLKLWLDFTRHLEAVAERLQRAILFAKPPEIVPGPYPSLARQADPAEWKRAATPERGLELVGEALQPFSEEKLVVFLGWGLGRYTSSGVQLTRGYERASEALRRADATVYVLDITDADFHSLEVGLRQVASDTGGVYEKTNRFPTQIAGRFARALGGSYALTFVPPPEGGPIEVELLGRGRILTASPASIGASDATERRAPDR